MIDICDRLMRFAGKVCLSTDTEVEAAAEIERLRAEIEKLRAALKPFADMICEVTDLHEDHDSIEECNRLTAGQIRAAAAVLKETDNA